MTQVQVPKNKNNSLKDKTFQSQIYHNSSETLYSCKDMSFMCVRARVCVCVCVCIYVCVCMCIYMFIYVCVCVCVYVCVWGCSLCCISVCSLCVIVLNIKYRKCLKVLAKIQACTHTYTHTHTHTTYDTHKENIN